MQRDYYLALAARGLRMPIGADLVLHEQADPDAIRLDGARLGAVIVETARRFRTPLAVPLMDLTIEQEALSLAAGVPAEETTHHQFNHAPTLPTEIPLTPRMRTNCAAIAHVAREQDLLPIGMAIGPFSLTTKLLADPITPVFLAGTGATAADEPEVALVESVLAAAERVIHRYVSAQLAAGAKAILICEPAANIVYFSPNQLAQDYAVFDRYVMTPALRLTSLLRTADADLIFHDCGELTDGMVMRFAGLGAAILSFGSSRRLWEDARRVPKDTVLYGNLPTKRFYDRKLSAANVERLAAELTARMAAAGHPFILGSECDVLTVPGAEAEIVGKVDAFMGCPCNLVTPHGH